MCLCIYNLTLGTIVDLDTICKKHNWGDEKCPPDMLKNKCFQAKFLDEIIPSLYAERETVCGSKMNIGTSMKESGTQVN